MTAIENARERFATYATCRRGDYLSKCLILLGWGTISHNLQNTWAGSITKCNTFLAGCCDGNQLRAFDGRGAGDPDGDAGGWLHSARRCSLPWSQSVHH